MTAFVLGATGFVGREVVRQLCVRGAKAIAHARADSSRLASLRATWTELGVEVDTTPWEDLATALARHRPDQLYILIGTTRAQAKSDHIEGDIYERVDFGLTKLAVDAARDTRPRLVYLSSVGADPSARSAYLRARGKAEAYVRDSGLPWVIARPSLIVGDRDESRPGENVAAAVGDGLLAVAGVLGGKRLRAKYRSTTPDVLASALIRIAEAPESGRIVEGAELR